MTYNAALTNSLQSGNALNITRSGDANTLANSSNIVSLNANHVIGANQTLQVQSGVVAGTAGTPVQGTLYLGNGATLADSSRGSGNGTLRLGNNSAVVSVYASGPNYNVDKFSLVTVDPGAKTYFEDNNPGWAEGTVNMATTNFQSYLSQCAGIIIDQGQTWTLGGGNLILGDGEFVVPAKGQNLSLTSTGGYAVVAASTAKSIGFASLSENYAFGGGYVSATVSASGGNGGAGRRYRRRHQHCLHSQPGLLSPRNFQHPGQC